MEEVDNIIIDSLRNLNSGLDENIQSLKEFSPDDVVCAIGSCLEAICPGAKIPRKLGATMTLKLKLATQLAEQIKDLGFKGDMGYQTILYCNEVEVRRVLMFLIERLPRETQKATITEAAGYVPRLVKEIEENVRLSLQKPWLPNNIVKEGARDCGNKYIKQGYGCSKPINTTRLEIPNCKGEATEEAKQYWVRHLPVVTKQCHPENLLASLLFKDSEFELQNTKLQAFLARQPSESYSKVDKLLQETSTMLETTPEASISSTNAESERKNEMGVNPDGPEAKIQALYQQIEAAKLKYVNLQKEFLKTEAKLSQLYTVKEKEDQILKDILLKVKVKTKTLSVLSKDDKMQKLKLLVENGNERLAQLATQWNEVQSPLLEKYNTLKKSWSEQELKIQNEQKRIREATEKNVALAKDLKLKENVEQQLIQECSKLPKSTNRNAYTRRILEIIGNIKKQNDEIQKVLKDTKEVQRDINNLNGQIDRSFTLSDELIFRDAKQDETARKAYKLLVALHTECEDVIQTVSDLGLVERETRNLEEQIDAETAKGTLAKLERVERDLQEVRKETNAIKMSQEPIKNV